MRPIMGRNHGSGQTGRSGEPAGQKVESTKPKPENAVNLYTYFRSSASFRVRIVLNAKGLPYTSIPIHMLRHGGEQHQPAYRAVNPQGLVPSLALDDGQVLTQSVAICEYLEETHPEPALLPANPLDRAWVRSVCSAIACDIHPLDNLRVLRYLKHELGCDDEHKNAWYAHWIRIGFEPLEVQLRNRAGRHCLGDTFSLADAFLIPQVWNARRAECPLADFPTITRLYDNAMALDAVLRAEPSRQPDAE